MKAIVAVLVAIVLTLAWLLYAEMATNRQQQSKIIELTSSLGDRKTRDSLELQEKCALQGEKIFRQQGYTVNQSNPLNYASHQSHYNAKLAKCFVTLDSTSYTSSGTQFTNRSLLDAYEQRAYAEYMWMSHKSKKYWEVPPRICKLIPSSADESLCTSEEEYKAFVARYME
jgi:hypothetical protein